VKEQLTLPWSARKMVAAEQSVIARDSSLRVDSPVLALEVASSWWENGAAAAVLTNRTMSISATKRTHLRRRCHVGRCD